MSVLFNRHPHVDAANRTFWRAPVVFLGLWYGWVLLSPVMGGGEFSFSSPYLMAPLFVILGFGAARQLKKLWSNRTVIPLLIAVTTVVVASQTIYANARGATGVLLVGLAALIINDERISTRAGASSRPVSARGSKNFSGNQDRFFSTGASANPRGRGKVGENGAERTHPNRVVLLALLVGITGILMSSSAQASFILALLLLLACVLAITWSAPPKWLSFLVGFLGVELAVIVVTYLGSRESWPDWLSDGQSLSSARHELWNDALELWSTNPVMGAGMGTFTASSELASTTPHLRATHSLFLQTGAELGAIGVLLLTCLFAYALYVSSTGARSAAFIGMMTWVSLGIHTSIDHLEDFPIVWLMAGAVLAWCRPLVPRNKSLKSSPAFN